MITTIRSFCSCATTSNSSRRTTGLRTSERKSQTGRAPAGSEDGRNVLMPPVRTCPYRRTTVLHKEGAVSSHIDLGRAHTTPRRPRHCTPSQRKSSTHKSHSQRNEGRRQPAQELHPLTQRKEAEPAPSRSTLEQRDVSSSATYIRICLLYICNFVYDTAAAQRREALGGDGGLVEVHVPGHLAVGQHDGNDFVLQSCGGEGGKGVSGHCCGTPSRPFAAPPLRSLPHPRVRSGHAPSTSPGSSCSRLVTRSVTVPPLGRRTAATISNRCRRWSTRRGAGVRRDIRAGTGERETGARARARNLWGLAGGPLARSSARMLHTRLTLGSRLARPTATACAPTQDGSSTCGHCSAVSCAQ